MEEKANLRGEDSPFLVCLSIHRLFVCPEHFDCFNKHRHPLKQKLAVQTLPSHKHFVSILHSGRSRDPELTSVGEGGAVPHTCCFRSCAT
jgi:hypothetical protein